MRKDYNFNNTIYIRVTSAWNADYYFYTSLVGPNSLAVTEDFSYYNSLAKGSIFNYFYEDSLSIDAESDENITTKRNFRNKN